MNKHELAESIISKMGGAENIQFVTHCMTRLRFKVKDTSKIDVEQIKALSDVMGIVDKGGQFQLIIGPTVPELYSEVANLLPNCSKEKTEEKQEKNTEEKKSFAAMLNSFMGVISSCITPLIPIIMTAGLIKLLAMLLGPSMFHVLPEDHNLIRLLTFVGDAGFYFFPFYVAYGAAKKFNTSVPITLFMAGILLHPSLIQIVADGQPFDVYGIPMLATKYAASFLPMILITWVMSYVEKGLKKIIPNYFKNMLVPLLTILIMLPIALCVLGPIGTVLGEVISKFIQWVYSMFGPLAVGLVSALWPLLIATGMHQALIPVAATALMTTGHDPVVLVGATIGGSALMGMALAYIFKAKGAEEKATATGNFITLTIGGISEPVIFGVLLRFKKAISYLLISGFIGGFVAGLLNVGYYFIGTTSIFAVLSFVGDNPTSFPYGCLAAAIALILGFVLPMVFGFGEDRQAVNKEEA